MTTHEGLDLFTHQAQACTTLAEVHAVRNTLMGICPGLVFTYTPLDGGRVILRCAPAERARERTIELGRGDLPA